MTILAREPVLAAGAVVSAILAVIGATNAFGLTTITQQQGEALTAAVVALWPILLVIRSLVWSPASVDAVRRGER